MRGPKDARGVVADRLLMAARESFAAVGFDRTTLRGIARDSGVDPALVRYYFGTKEELFRAALDAPPDYLGNMAEVESSPPEDRGRTIARVVLASWENPETALVWRSLFLSAMTEPSALERLENCFVGVFAATIAPETDPVEREVRQALATADIIGVVTGRYLWKVDGLASVPLEELEESLGETLQRHLTGPLAVPARSGGPDRSGPDRSGPDPSGPDPS